MDAMLGADRSPLTQPLLVALQFIKGGEQGPGATVLQTHMAATATHPRLEAEPGLDTPVGLAGFAPELESMGCHILQAGRQHRRDRLGSLLGA